VWERESVPGSRVAGGRWQLEPWLSSWFCPPPRVVLKVAPSSDLSPDSPSTQLHMPRLGKRLTGSRVAEAWTGSPAPSCCSCRALGEGETALKPVPGWPSPVSAGQHFCSSSVTPGGVLGHQGAREASSHTVANVATWWLITVGSRTTAPCESGRNQGGRGSVRKTSADLHPGRWPFWSTRQRL
jgi:hypothetical protein